MRLTKTCSGVLTLLGIFISAFGIAQSTEVNSQFWQEAEYQMLMSTTGAEQYVFAEKADYYTMDNYDALHQSVLAASPGEVIHLPMADGNFHTFTFSENTTMGEGLKAEFPHIRSYNIISTESRNTWGKMEVTHHGLNAVILIPGESSQFITPVFMNDPASYMVYHRSDYIPTQEFQCHVGENADEHREHRHHAKSEDPYYECELRNYNIAISATGEFTNSQGGDVDDALAAMVVTVDNLNAVFEREFASTLTLVDETVNVIYTNAASDPFNNNSLDAMINANVAVLQDNVGSQLYDVGHVFGTVGGGLAQLNSACVFGESNPPFYTGKERGGTGSVFAGGPFPADVVAHELGHQFGASHVFNNPCGGNVSQGTSVEVGAGTSIMSYAGVCFPGPQNFSFDHYNGMSLEQIGIEFDNDDCAETLNIDNNPPVLAPLPNEINIPILTPFALTAEASDEDGDVLTYKWEQQNAFLVDHPPQADYLEGPAFRNFELDLSPTRYIPSSSNGLSTTWEVLSEVARIYFFRVTVRDNAPGGGCNVYGDTQVNTIAEAGPFLVEYPSAIGIDWIPYTEETILWDVANTTAAPINADLVDIFLSIDSGDNFDIQLADDVPNNGSFTVEVPNIVTNDARIRVINSDGTFFDVSNNDFDILGFVEGFYFEPLNDGATGCQTGDVDLLVDIVQVGEHAEEIALSVSGLPEGVTAELSEETAMAGDQVTITLSNLSSTDPDLYSFTLDGVAVDFENTIGVNFGVADADLESASLISPSDEETDIGTFTELIWNDNATTGETYILEVATDDEFSNLIVNESGLVESSYEVFDLEPFTTYYWRVTNTSVCGDATPSEVFEFITVQCAVREYTGSTTNIPDNNLDGIESTMFVNLIGQISDVNVVDVTGNHPEVSDLSFTLISPSGTEVLLTEDNCNMYLTIMPNGEILVDVPNQLSGTYDCSGSSNFGNPVPDEGISGRLVYAYDGTSNPQALCEEPINADEVAGNIALVYRGVCNFQTKVLNAQEAGAIAVIVANNQPGDAYFDMGGEEDEIFVSSVMVGNNNGNLFRDNEGGNVEGFSFSFDDQSFDTTIPCPSNDGGTYVPVDQLSSFNGENSSGTWILRMVDNDAGSSGSMDNWGLEFCFDGNVVVSTSDRNQINAQIFPNPTRDLITVQLESDKASKISLLDISGRIIETEVPTSNQTQFDLSELSNGIYFVKIEGESFAQSVFKVIKN